MEGLLRDVPEHVRRDEPVRVFCRETQREGGCSRSFLAASLPAFWGHYSGQPQHARHFYEVRTAASNSVSCFVCRGRQGSGSHIMSWLGVRRAQSTPGLGFRVACIPWTEGCLYPVFSGSLRWMLALCVFGCAYCTSTWSLCRATFHVR